MHTVGFLYPGYSAEDEYPLVERLLGADTRLEVVHTRMREDAHRVDALHEVGSTEVLADGAAELLRRGVEAVLWACTSGSFVFGWDGAHDQVEALAQQTGLPASSTSFAFVRALEELRLRRVAVAATYPADVAERFTTFLAAAGVEVVRLSSRGIIIAAEVGTLGRTEVLDFVVANDDPTAEAVLVPDTALHTVAWLKECEQHLGKPVLTANQVSVWAALRLVGDTAPRRGLGTLFADRGTVTDRVATGSGTSSPPSASGDRGEEG